MATPRIWPDYDAWCSHWINRAEYEVRARDLPEHRYEMAVSLLRAAQWGAIKGDGAAMGRALEALHQFLNCLERTEQ